jgi:predicted RND superfamily exporter protein
VVALVLLAFGLGRRSARSLADAAWVLAALAVGVLWFLGLAGALGLRLNMLNFIALPITFGIGVDYATNIFQRRRLDHAGSIAHVVRTTGGAVALCSLTTIIGYSSLLIARNQALISFGILADLGEVACLAAALLAFPAVLRWREIAKAGRSAPAGGASVGIEPQP